ncbi:hypothetical protein EJ08DRAFT_656927 [Tothia fuscella]|uniref:Uncharacterized protein n=1 Tax=Tothia fuscella TaxID=1048955 RepID=A0A9P4U382_9PEZI|nr:hypothetical protein EJ08DRAFT_656927 [Tothia fuscella]
MRHALFLRALVAVVVADAENGTWSPWSPETGGVLSYNIRAPQPPPACTNCGVFLNNYAQCRGLDKCQCFNEFYLQCWKKNQDRCEIPVMACTTPDGRQALPVPLNSEFPPCGRLFPGCPGAMSCRTIRKLCIDVDRSGDCMGLCLPRPGSFQAPGTGPRGSLPTQQPGLNPYTQPKPPAQPVTILPPAPAAPTSVAPAPGAPPRTYEPKPGNSLCPANMRCPREDDLCVPDPRNPGPAPAFLCGYPDTYCGGNDMKACPAGKICSRDPREKCNPADGDSRCQGICL